MSPLRLGVLTLLAPMALACGVGYSPLGTGAGASTGEVGAGTTTSSGTTGSTNSGTTSNGSGTGGSTTAGATNGTGTTGTGTSGSTGTTTTSGTTGSNCSSTVIPVENSSCGRDQDCGCPLLCDVSSCRYRCGTTADCVQNAGDSCQVGYCNLNYCSVDWAACNAAGSGDGTCIPQPFSQPSVCFQAGPAIVGANCDLGNPPTRDGGPLCVPGAFCLPTASQSTSSCFQGCDPTVDAGSCPSGEGCVAVVGSPSHPVSMHTGYCLMMFMPDAGPDGGLLLPQIAHNAGRAALAVPDLVTVTFQGYPYAVLTYGDWMVRSQWLSTVGADYGVSNGGRHLADLVIADTPAANITDTDVRDLITNMIADGGIPAPGNSTIYLVYYPDTTTITSFGSQSCQYGGFGGYHDLFFPDGGTTPIVYGVIATCPNSSGFGPTEADGVSLAASHEFIEAATDPDPTGQNGADRAWAFTDYVDPWPYSFGEVGDPCTGARTTETTDAGSFLAQRIWSNTAAKNGFESPCIPIPSGEVYFTGYTNPAPAQFISLVGGVGQTITYTIIPWESAAVAGGFSLYAVSTVYDPTNGVFAGSVTLSQADGGSASGPAILSNVYVGAPLTLSVDVPAGTSSRSLVQVQIYSFTDPTFTVYNIWPAAVIVQ